MLRERMRRVRPLFSMCPDAAYAGEPPELVRRFRAHYLNVGNVLAFNNRDAFHLRRVALAAAVRALIGAAWPVAARRVSSWEEPFSAVNAYHQAAFRAPLAAGSRQLKARAAAVLASFHRKLLFRGCWSFCLIPRPGGLRLYRGRVGRAPGSHLTRRKGKQAGGFSVGAFSPVPSNATLGLWARAPLPRAASGPSRTSIFPWQTSDFEY